MRTTCLALLGCLLFAGVASAATISQTHSYSGTPNYNQTFTFDEFDDQGGALTLLSIKVIFDLDVDGGVFILDNDGVLPAAGNYEFGAKGNISSTDVSLLDVALQPVTAELSALTVGAFALAGNQGDGPNDFDPSAPDGTQINGGPHSDSDNGFITPAAFAQYIGVGTYDCSTSATLGISVCER